MRRPGRFKKRILIIVGTVVALAAVGVGLYIRNEAQLDREALHEREVARRAMAAGEHARALAAMNKYDTRFRDRGATAEDFVLLGKARREVVVPGVKRSHLQSAARQFRKAMTLDPNNLEAQNCLLDVYRKLPRATEAVALVDILLATAPDDLRLLRTKREMLVLLRQFPKALEVAARIDPLSREDLDDALRMLELLFVCNRPDREVDAWIENAIASRASDPRFKLLRSAACLKRNEIAQATTALDAAVAACPTSDDSTFVAETLKQYDAARRYADSLKLLGRIGRTSEPKLLVAWLRKLWYAERLDEIASKADLWDVDALRADPEVQAILASTWAGLGKTAELEAIKLRLGALKVPAAPAWSAVLPVARDDAKSRAGALAALLSAVSAVPESALIRNALADVYAAVGETELALESWREASERAPEWSAPLRRGAQACAAAGRFAQARELAQAALAITPKDAGSLSVLVSAKIASAGKLGGDEVQAMLRDVVAARRESPSKSDVLLPAHARLLMIADKAAAEACMREAIRSPPAPAELTLLSLAAIARNAGMPVGEELLDFSERTHGSTPSLALLRAHAKSLEAGVDAGATVFEASRGGGAAGRSELEWDLARAAYFDSVRDPRAGPAWVGCAAAHPDDLAAQLGAIASNSAWGDRASMAKIIDRTEALAGDSAMSWRVARARWKISAPAPGESDFADAATLLAAALRSCPQDVSARLLNARVQEKLGNVISAQEQIRLAVEAAPGSQRIEVELARLLRMQGDVVGARIQLDCVSLDQSLAPPQTERAAFVFATAGDARRGAELFQMIADRSEESREGLLVVAQLYADIGERERALAICARLLDRTDPGAVELAAGLHAVAGRVSEARELLSRLDGAQVRQGERELVRARHAARWGTAADATDWFAKAVERAPDREEAWIERLCHALDTGDVPTVSAILEDPRAAKVDSLRALVDIRQVCVAATGDPKLRPPLLSALRDASGREALLEAVRRVAADWSDPDKRAPVVLAVRRLADAAPRVLDLQLLAANLCAESGAMEQARQLSARTCARFPSSSAAACQAAEMLARNDRWSEALEPALAWDNLTSRQDPRPDHFLARAFLGIGRAEEAVSCLEPFVPGWRARAVETDPFLLTYVLSLVRADRSAQAAKLLADLVRASERWRTVPLSVEPIWMGDKEHARSWLDLCAANVPAADLHARFVLAQSWLAAARHFADPSFVVKGKEILASVTAAPDAPAAAIFLQAKLAQESGDVEAARGGYLLTLSRDERFSDARNSLALLLANAGDWQQAVEEATKAVREQPKNPAYFDTLAFALRKGGDFAKAEETLRAAVELQPTNPEWRVSLAETLVQNGKKDEAKREVARVDEIVARNVGAINYRTKARLELLRTR